MKDTRQTLLESACRIFAQKGFHEANVAEICKRAKANIAAINYHFGGKKLLYMEVLHHAAEVADREFPLICRDLGIAPEERLHRFIRAQFDRGSCKGLAGCFDRLVVHEMINPSFAHGALFNKQMRPRREYLFALVRELLPSGASEHHVRICTHHVVGLFAFHHFHEALRVRHRRMKLPPKPPKPPAPSEMARHATVFALGGIQAISQQVLNEDSASEGDVREEGTS